MAYVRRPRVSVQIRQPGQARLGGCYTLVVLEHPRSGLDPPNGSNRKRGARRILIFKFIILKSLATTPKNCLTNFLTRLPKTN